MRGRIALSILCGLVACKRVTEPKPPTFEVPELGMSVPKLSGWVVDRTVNADDFAKGGVIFRLLRESAVPMSPRIDVYIEPLKTRPTILEDFLNQNLREMGNLETAGNVRIMQVDQRPISLGPRRAFHVLHEYTLLTKGQTPISVTQVSTILIVDGRGVAVTAAGRTELFHPLGDSIERILTGLTLPPPKGPGAQSGRGLPPGITEPVDLGKVGGNK